MGQDLMDQLMPTERPRGRRVSAYTVVGILFLLIGLGAIGVYAYQYFGTNVVAERAYQQEKEGLRKDWQSPAPSAQPSAPVDRIPGQAMGLMRIPKLGADYEVPILAGTEDASLARGIGWYESSVHPGQVGNFAVAGHRVTHGEPFRRILELHKGDQVIVETRNATFTYVLDTSPADLTVQDKDVWVLDPVPGKPGQQPTQATLTLTTCQDLFHSADRSVGFGHLVDTKEK